MADQRHAIIWCTLFIVHGMLLSQTFAQCSSNQFKCSDGKCILREKMCDGRQDCPDKMDETNCDLEKCEGPLWFQCSLPRGPCLSADLICNDFDNCPGGEDEHNCEESVESQVRGRNKTIDLDLDIWHAWNRNCSKFEYTCASDKTCIPLDFMCNGEADCNDDSDEIDGCVKAKTNCKGFFCNNKKCLESRSWVCDNIDDCGDNSDEHQCMSLCNAEFNRFACSDNKTCIALSQVCDNKDDCPDKTDESTDCALASETCNRMKCPPVSQCKILPHQGAICICPTGYRMSKIQNACVDIDECSEKYGVCSQKCTNQPGGYTCVCDDGYRLRSDNHSCEALAGDALLFYTTQATVMSVHLRTKRVQTVARNLTKVIGVAYDGEHVFWTNIQHEAESIVRANANGSQQEILLTSGLDAPEDLAVDWLTGNIYFSDNIMHHIAVCTNDGVFCTILVTIDVHQPRGIALWPQLGQMFWTDWGVKPMIARASMDGGNMMAIVSDKIHWPNGIALDMHNNRIYWVDAKLSTVESARTDGTDRRIVLQDILKHPYGLAVFEEKLYWSDWGTKSVHSCNKFTGKEHNVVVKDRTMYAVHIYHSAKQPQSSNPCENAHCSHLCLLREKHSFSCACPEDMFLSEDQLRCVKTQKPRRLYIALRSILLQMEHTNFGRHIIEKTHNLPVIINEMVYNSVNGTIIIVDNIRQTIYEYDVVKNHLNSLTHGNMGNITGLAFDHLSYNVYWVDSERHVVEVLSLITRERAIVSFFSGEETPIAVTVIPQDGIMFVALKNRRMIHIDQIALSGQGQHTHVFEDELGHREIKFATDFETNTLYWSDSDIGQISFSDYRSLEAFSFRSRLRRPYSMALVDGDLFWSELRSSAIHWTHKSNLGPLKRIDVEPLNGGSGFKHTTNSIKLVASAPPIIANHPCQTYNGGCSHVCVTLTKDTSSCLCPAGLVFKDSKNHTCIEALDCEFRCSSGECLTLSHRCNGRKDCRDGSDELECDAKTLKKPKVICDYDQVPCRNGEQCIDIEDRCDGNKNCNDGSDEDHCENFDASKKCHHHQHVCENNHCVDLSSVCDGTDDCGDNSDEVDCDNKNQTHVTCGKNMFQCNVGSCISKDWECDGKLDCIDGSDEHSNCALKECAPKMHKCLMGQCIAEQLKCDGHNDCGDFSDELNCKGSKITESENLCSDEEFQCKSGPNICLEMSAKCNGTAECPRGEDEADCGNMCSFSEFQCKTSHECIRKEFRCDHDRDCNDGSDELNCNYASNSTASHESFCAPGMFDCKDGMCVDQSRVCNDFDDCENAADEGTLCMTACKTSGSRAVCDHKCHATPSGAICSCFAGYKLDVDQRSCEDIDECEMTNPCAQICENTRGSYRCSCFADFMLRTDKTTCKSMTKETSWLFSSYNEVRSLTDYPVTLNVAWTANDSKINGFDIDVHRRQAYFTTENEDVLYRVNMTSGAITSALSVNMPTKVAVDWITGNVYVVNRGSTYQINVCSFEAEMCGRLIAMNNHEVIRALTIDAYNRKIFFVTVKTLTFGTAFSQINMAHLDGKERQALVSKTGGFITALAADIHKKELYYVDIHSKTLQSISYAAGSDHKSKTIIQKGYVVMHPSGLAVYENEVIIVNIGAKEAIRCKLFADNACKSFNLNILNAEDITVDGASRQPMRRDACSMAACGGMCLQAEYGYECMCADSFVTENHTCAKGSHAIGSSALFVKNAVIETQRGGHGGGFILIMILLLITLLILGIGYYYFYNRRTGQGHRDFNINLHFQNPLSKLASKSTTDYHASSSYSAATESCDNEWQKVSFAIPKIQKLLRPTAPLENDTEILLHAAESSEICTMGEAGQSGSILVNENIVKYDATRSTWNESNTRLVDLM